MRPFPFASLAVAFLVSTITSADAVVIVTDHSSVDYQRVVALAGVIVDTRNATAKLAKGKGRIVSLASTATYATA